MPWEHGNLTLGLLPGIKSMDCLSQRHSKNGLIGRRHLKVHLLCHG